MLLSVHKLPFNFQMYATLSMEIKGQKSLYGFQFSTVVKMKRKGKKSAETVHGLKKSNICIWGVK